MNTLHLYLQAERLLGVAAMLAGIVVCAGIVGSCLCRLNAARVSPGRLTLTQLMYLAFAWWAFGTLLDLVGGSSLGFHQAAVGLGIVIHLHLTYRQWAGEDVVADALHWEDGHADPTNG